MQMLFERFLFSFQKQDKFMDDLHVLAAGYLAGAGSDAVVHIMFQAGPAYVPVKFYLTAAEGKYRLHDIHGVHYRTLVREGAEITRPVRCDVPDYLYPGPLFG